jgi:plastocyanin
MRAHVFPALALMTLASVPAVPPVDIGGTTGVADRLEPQAIVWIDAPAVPGRPSPAGRIVLDQRNLDFAPHVLAVRAGTVVEFPNHDRVFHNVFSFHDGKRFDLGLYPIGAVKYVKFDHAGLSRILCNIHPNMAAYVMTVDTPYFAVSGDNGRFTIPEVPRGTYTYHAWRPGRAELAGSIAVEPGANLAIRW